MQVAIEGEFQARGGRRITVFPSHSPFLLFTNILVENRRINLSFLDDYERSAIPSELPSVIPLPLPYHPRDLGGNGQ
jgi:hypothetical protein